LPNDGLPWAARSVLGNVVLGAALGTNAKLTSPPPQKQNQEERTCFYLPPFL